MKGFLIVGLSLVIFSWMPIVVADAAPKWKGKIGIKPAKMNLRKIRSPGQLKRCNPNPAKIRSVNKCSNIGLLNSGSTVRIGSVVRRKKSGQSGIWCNVTVLYVPSPSQVSTGARGWVRRNKIRNPRKKGC